MVISSLLLVIFALFVGVILTLSEYELLAILGIIIVCLCFLVYLWLFNLWQTTEINAMEKRFSAEEDFIKYLKDKCNKKENKDE